MLSMDVQVAALVCCWAARPDPETIWMVATYDVTAGSTISAAMKCFSAAPV